MVISLVGYGESSTSTSTSNLTSGKKITLPQDILVANSRENNEKLTNYCVGKNTQAVKGMITRGEATTLYKGSTVNIIKVGIVTEVETDNGQKWFAPMESLEDK